MSTSITFLRKGIYADETVRENQSGCKKKQSHLYCCCPNILRVGYIFINEMEKQSSNPGNSGWPQRPEVFPDLMTPIEAAMFLRLDDTSHNPESACRTLNYRRDRSELRATKFARRIWYLRRELERFLENKTEEGV